jgi:hypothetical protein
MVGSTKMIPLSMKEAGIFYFLYLIGIMILDPRNIVSIVPIGGINIVGDKNKWHQTSYFL